jgi:uncharacterized protein YxjI
MGQPTPPPSWYDDPAGNGQLRWWDGRQWTEHTQQRAPAPRPEQQGGLASQQPMPVPDGGYPAQQQQTGNALELNVDGRSMGADRVQQQVQRDQQRGGHGAVGGGGGTLFTEPVLVVNQKAKIYEASAEYAVFDQQGRQLGAVVQIGQTGFGKAVKMFSHNDALMPVKLELRDAGQQPVIVIHKPVTMWKAKIQVTMPNGQPIGEIGQDNVFGKIRFNYLVNGQRIGGLRAENWRAWDFQITDGYDQEIARITKSWEGMAKAMFTNADNYVIRIHAPRQGALAPMVLASALTVDTVLRQRK